jgi:BirA family biotin operon repressor/biotin-[acetyl-CoA-carboxylase] ligase
MKNHNYIEKKLRNEIGDIKVEYYSSIGSTNDYLLDIKYTHNYHFCYADMQTKGRGRQGGKWVSQDKDNIYSTLAFTYKSAIADSSLISIKIALAVLQALKNYIPQQLQKYLKIKLPNDIYFKDQKLSGILIETKNIKKDQFDIVIGVGVNVNMSSLDESIDRQWTSLALINQANIDSSDVIISLVKSLIQNYQISDNETLLAFSGYDYTLDKKITFKYANHDYQGIAKGITKELQLKLIDEQGNATKFDLVNISKIRIIQ